MFFKSWVEVWLKNIHITSWEAKRTVRKKKYKQGEMSTAPVTGNHEKQPTGGWWLVVVDRFDNTERAAAQNMRSRFDSLNRAQGW